MRKLANLNRITLTISLSTFAIFSFAGFIDGGAGPGGGDLMCDARIQMIAENIHSWLDGFGPESGPGINLSSTLNPATRHSYSVKEYEVALQTLLSNKVDASCVAKGNSNYPVEVGGSAKICKSIVSSGRVHMVCDRDLFMKLSFDDRIQQIHHELAINIPGLEPDQGPLSTYKISVQLSAFTRDVSERKLVVLPPLGSDENEIRAAHDAIAEMIGSDSTFVSFDVKCYSDFAKNDHVGDAIDTHYQISDRGIVHIVLGKVLIAKALKLQALACSDGSRPTAIDGIEEKITALQVKNPDGTKKTTAGGSYIFEHKKSLTLTVNCTGGKDEPKELPLQSPLVGQWVQEMIQRTSAIASIKDEFSQGQFELERPDGTTDVLKIAANSALIFDQTKRVATRNWSGTCRTRAIGMIDSEKDLVITFKVTGHTLGTQSVGDQDEHCKEYANSLSRIDSDPISFADGVVVDLKQFNQTKRSMSYDQLNDRTP